MPTSPNPDLETDGQPFCAICGKEPICEGMGVVRYDVPVSDSRFGKLFRCPNNPLEADVERKERLRRISNLDVFAGKTFDNFETHSKVLTRVENESLGLAFGAAMSFAQEMHGWLVLEGTYGCGKTHLAAAIGNARIQRGDVVLFITVPDLLDYLRSAFAPSSEVTYDDAFDRIRSASLLILDDLGSENTSSWAAEKLFQLLNYRHSRQLPTVITTNTDVDALDPRLRSRLLDEGLIHRVRISAPDYRTAIRNKRDSLLSNLTLYQDKTFERFDTHTRLYPEERRNLEEARAVSQAYAQRPDGWLVLTGKFHGCGKTHLAAAVAHHVHDSGQPIIFITVPDLLDHLRITYNPSSPVSFDQRFQLVRNAPFLVLDDLETEYASPWAKEKLFQIIDHRYITRQPTVITTSKQLYDDKVNDRFISRLLDRRLCNIVTLIVPPFTKRIERR